MSEFDDAADRSVVRYAARLSRERERSLALLELQRRLEEHDRFRESLQKIALRDPCVTADDMSRLARDTLGWKPGE
jgi:hypothetical protein